jgi:uncharacterized protein YndB with AHSA1/START domain
MAAYRFLTTWLLEAPREAVWDTISDAERWPEWWARRRADGGGRRAAVALGLAQARHGLDLGVARADRIMRWGGE